MTTTIPKPFGSLGHSNEELKQAYYGKDLLLSGEEATPQAAAMPTTPAESGDEEEGEEEYVIVLQNKDGSVEDVIDADSGESVPFVVEDADAPPDDGAPATPVSSSTPIMRSERGNRRGGGQWKGPGRGHGFGLPRRGFSAPRWSPRSPVRRLGPRPFVYPGARWGLGFRPWSPWFPAWLVGAELARAVWYPSYPSVQYSMVPPQLREREALPPIQGSIPAGTPISAINARLEQLRLMYAGYIARGYQIVPQFDKYTGIGFYAWMQVASPYEEGILSGGNILSDCYMRPEDKRKQQWVEEGSKPSARMPTEVEWAAYTKFKASLPPSMKTEPAIRDETELLESLWMASGRKETFVEFSNRYIQKVAKDIRAVEAANDTSDTVAAQLWRLMAEETASAGKSA